MGFLPLRPAARLHGAPAVGAPHGSHGRGRGRHVRHRHTLTVDADAGSIYDVPEEARKRWLFLEESWNERSFNAWPAYFGAKSVKRPLAHIRVRATHRPQLGEVAWTEQSSLVQIGQKISRQRKVFQGISCLVLPLVFRDSHHDVHSQGLAVLFYSHYFSVIMFYPISKMRVSYDSPSHSLTTAHMKWL